MGASNYPPGVTGNEPQIAGRPDKPKRPKVLKVPAVLEVKLETVAAMLVGAFEGGSNYWAQLVKKKRGTKGKEYVAEFVEATDSISCAMSPGGYVLIKDIEGGNPKPYRLDLAKIKRGLAIMAKEEPRHFNDMVQENDDATTADVFLQCCVFQKKSIYG